MNRLLLFVHYNKYNLVSDYIFYILKEMKPLFKRVIFISNSQIPQQKYNEIKKYANKIIERPNKGFDFGAWRDGLLSEGWDNLYKYDSITLMNDTCFGPLFPMVEVYKKMEKMQTDFWGITSHKETKNGMPGSNGPIPEHIQSYFIVYNKNVVCSDEFKNFWSFVKDYEDVEQVIQNYETQLTRILQKAGFQYSVYFSEMPSKCNPDLANWQPDVLFKNRVPFLKIKALLLHMHPRYLLELLKTHTNYPVELVYQHFNSIFPPNVTLKIQNKILLCDDVLHKQKTNFKAAIHYHAYYPEMIEEFFINIFPYSENIDFFITTDTDKKKEIIKNKIRQCGIKSVKEISVVKNRGRDVLPWLLLANKLYKYKIVGHFHSKKSPTVEDWVGESWQGEIFKSLIIGIPDIFNSFINNKDVGIIISAIPYYFLAIPIHQPWGENVKICQNLYDKLISKKDLAFSKLKIPIMPYGTMFWYRPEALKPLFDLNLTEQDFPEEPLPVDGTIAHAIERLPVYIAWSQGYDFRIAIHKDNIMSGFEYLEIKPEIIFLQNVLVKTRTIIFARILYKIWKRVKTFFRF